MLTQEVAEKRLSQWKLTDEEKDVKDDRTFADVLKLPKSLKSIGLAFLDSDADGKKLNDWETTQKVQRQAAIDLEALSETDRIKLLRVFFPKIAEWLEAAWQLLKSMPYQVGYSRKSFRAPTAPSATLSSRMDWFLRFRSSLEDYRENEITLEWLAQWAPHAMSYSADSVAPVLAAAINSNGKEGKVAYEILRQSVTNEHEVGSMGSHVTRSLLMSSREEGWELIEKTLLAAQRQEGLRQSILEAVDESHPTAFRRMLRLIQEHELARFSAVTRAVNVWLGLMWDSATVKVINDNIAQTLLFLEDQAARKKALRSDDATAVYRALWCIGFEDAHASIPEAEKLLRHKSDEHRFVATWFLGMLGLSDANKARLPAIDDANLQVAMTAFQGASGLRLSEDYESVLEENEERAPDGFEAAERLFHRLPEKSFKLKALVWPWTEREVDRADVCAVLLELLGNRPVTVMIPYLKSLKPWTQSRVVQMLAEQKKWDNLTRETLFSMIGHVSQDVRKAAFSALEKQELKGDEPVLVEGLLTRKASDLRQAALKMLLRQPDQAALASADRLTASKDGPQRLAGLEMLRHLAEANRERGACQQRASVFAEQRKKLVKEEQTQLTAIQDSDREIITLDNALGLMDPSKRTPVVPPKKRSGESFTPAALKCLQGLDDLVHQHRETSVKITTYLGEREILLGTMPDYGFPSPDLQKGTPESELHKLPLSDVWLQWWKKRAKTLCDKDGLELVRAHIAVETTDDWQFESMQNWAKKSPDRRAISREITGDLSGLKLKYPGVVGHLLEWLLFLHPPQNVADFFLDQQETANSLITPRLMEKLITDDDESSADNDDDDDDWRNMSIFRYWISNLDSELSHCRQKLTTDQIRRQWELEHWRDEPVTGADRHRPDFSLLLEARKAGFASSDDLMDQLLGPRLNVTYGARFSELNTLTERSSEYFTSCVKDLPELPEMLDRIRARVMEIELTRGEAPTPATGAALSIESFYGTKTLFQVLSAIDKAKLKKEAGWRSDGTSRGATLTHLLQATYPLETDSQADFDRLAHQALEEGYCTDQRFLELAFLAPQWTKFVENFLNWRGFSEGLYWFVAHMNTGWNSGVENAAAEAEGIEGDTDSDESDESADDNVSESEASSDEPKVQRRKLTAWQRLLLERTALTDVERSEGAVDVAWFHRTWELLGSQRWQQMAEAARYAANPAQAKKAQFLADVLLGNTTRKELVDSIQKKQRKDHVRLLGLLPLAKGAKQETDILERYEILQEYRRYARKLSGLTRPSAMRACDIGFDNLARLAGFPDPLRLEWAMEAESVKDLAKGPVSQSKDGITVTLLLDDQARPQLTVQRGDKALKTVPPAVKKKHAVIAELFERGADLRKKASRMKQSLEAAMCRGDVFTGAEMETLSGHAILAPLLTRLVLVGESDLKIVGYLDKKGKSIRDHAGKQTAIKKTDRLRIAHPSDFLARKDWDRWQHECFSAERVQPFKQIFRELYVVTKQEQTDGATSQRYSGQQINPTQGFALWNSRGWNTQDDVFKTFHDSGITASVLFQYAYGTAAEVEGLTLSSIRFHHRDKPKPLLLSEVPSRIFSEVMRDVDLVVSVAHRGGVDPEASASTVEMRAALLRETTELLSLKNVRIKGVHVLIKGQLGEYSVHLGSANVHRMPGGSICIIPVHAQHRGRLFLPFADDDPRTAELMSKVLMLARDQEIQDPSILEQLR